LANIQANQENVIMREPTLFQNREEAAHQLAARLKKRVFQDPLILAIPRGGVVTGVVLAQELQAELDVIISRKLRSPFQAEVVIGAVAENGTVFHNPLAPDFEEIPKDYLQAEIEHQLAEIERRRSLIRTMRVPATITGRSVIVTDDGIATGATMIAALQAVRQQQPLELIVAVPVASPDRINEIRLWCDDLVYLHAPADFMAVGQFYKDFSPVEDDEVLQILEETELTNFPAVP
jgi:putative phosphoribosyl transferase